MKEVKRTQMMVDIDNNIFLLYNAGTMNSVSNDKAYNKNYGRLNKVGEGKDYVLAVHLVEMPEASRVTRENPGKIIVQ
ncbi:MAG: hypothetical protein WBB67_15615 [bacterium]